MGGRGRWAGSALTAMALAGAALAGAPAAAQELPRATPTLPADHWAVQAARAVHEMGLDDGWFPAAGRVSFAVVDRTLRRGAASAADGPPGTAELVAHWLARWEEEVAHAAPGPVPLRLGGEAGLGALAERGTAAPGHGLVPHPDRGPVRRDPYTGVEAGARGWLGSPHVAASLNPTLGPDGARLERWELAAVAGPVRVAAMRAPVSYAEGVTIHPGAPFVRGELALEEAGVLPGFLRHLGPVTFHTFAARLDDERHGDRPWLWGARAGIRPHPRFTLGVNRAAMIGGDENPTPLTFGNLARTMLGVHVGDLADQIVSLDARWRLPTDPALPVTVYLEGGAEDSSGAWYKVPGVVMGLHLPAVPGAANLALGVEHAYIGRSCAWRAHEPEAGVAGPCASPPWYRHRRFWGGWVVGEAMLGHPMGGNGTESALYGRLSLPVTALELRGRGFVRTRGPENLFAPQREGRSVGGTVRADWRPLPRSALHLEVRGDFGEGWREGVVRAGARVFFQR